MGQITVFSGPERRRRWTDEQRLQILTEAFARGACPTEVVNRTGFAGDISARSLRGLGEWYQVGMIFVLHFLRRADHPASPLDQLLPWNWRTPQGLLSQAA